MLIILLNNLLYKCFVYFVPFLTLFLCIASLCENCVSLRHTSLPPFRRGRFDEQAPVEIDRWLPGILAADPLGNFLNAPALLEKIGDLLLQFPPDVIFRYGFLHLGTGSPSAAKVFQYTPAGQGLKAGWIPLQERTGCGAAGKAATAPTRELIAGRRPGSRRRSSGA